MIPVAPGRRLVILALALGSGAFRPVRAQNGGAHPVPAPSVKAAPRVSDIAVDGRLEEAAWMGAAPATDFRQSRPDEGKAATQRTEVRFLYDADALFIGARMFDSLGARGVRTRLVRRDAFAESDLLEIILDTHHDHLSRTIFTINPSGVKGDSYGPGGTNTDDSWDPVWEGAAGIDSLGWTAELRIPFSQLRFPRDSVQTWGVQLWRTVQRLNEISQWAFWGLNEVGGPSRFGHIEDIGIAGSPGRAEILPYVVGRSTNVPPVDSSDPFHDPHRLDSRFGIDLKYLLTSNLTLSATVNPDFGQVEVDPAVVNLSAFETFFNERRPFFVEGGGILGFGGFSCYFCSNVSSLSMFYSRRIGRQPQGGGNAFAAGEYADVPENTAILGAAKITGRTGGGTTIGLLNALTRRERATVAASDDSRFLTEVEPLTNYFVGRVKQDLNGGRVVVGGIATSVIRDIDDPALRLQLNGHAESFGLDTRIAFGNERTYSLIANAALSQIAGDSLAIRRSQNSSARYFQRPDREHGGNGVLSDRFDPSMTTMRGLAGYARFAKDAGTWLWEVATNIRTPGFENNDMAFLTRADYVWMNANVFPQFTKPTSWYRSLGIIGGAQQQYNFDGDLTDRQVHGFVYWDLLNYWGMNTFFIRRPAVLDDRMTRGGPVVRRPGNNFWAYNLFTDSRKPIVVSFFPNYSWTDEGVTSYQLGFDVRFKPAANVSFSVGPYYSRSRSSRQFVTSQGDSTALAFFGRRYVFADLDQRSLSMDTRLNITFTPTLTLELYAQPFISSQAYSRFKEFVAPRQQDMRVFGEDGGTVTATGEGFDLVYNIDPDGAGTAEPIAVRNPDFSFRSLRGNAVVRWEYRPGSTLFLVWTQSRSDIGPDPLLRFRRDVDALFAASADNIFLIKMNYWLGI